MELVKNRGCLFNYIQEEDLTIYEKLKIFYSIVLAVKDLHDGGCCHSDLKPENLVYYYDTKSKKKYVKLIDFNCVTKVKKGKTIKGLYPLTEKEKEKKFNEWLIKNEDKY